MAAVDLQFSHCQHLHEVKTDKLCFSPVQSCEMLNIEDYGVAVSDVHKMIKVMTSDAWRFMLDCLRAAGAAPKPAEQQAELLIQADRIGHPGVGLNRLEEDVNDILTGACHPNNDPKILKQSASTAWVDANNVLGATASHFCMDIAICKAQVTGVGWVVVKGSNHNGMAGFWAQKAADVGLIGMAFTNTPPMMPPTRSKKPALGANPLALVAPALHGDSFYLDMATTVVSVEKLKKKLRKGEKLPLGWALGPDGKETTDPQVAYKTRCLLPLGGTEKSAGFKGYGLSAMVEMLCGVSAGSHYGHHFPSRFEFGVMGPANLGQCFIAVNPECFAPGFGERLSDCLRFWRELEPADPSLPVLAPGDKEKMHSRETDRTGTVSYDKKLMEHCAALARKLNVMPMVLLDSTSTQQSAF